MTGHRNPQGLVIHPRTGEIWESEHGPKGGDELNIIYPGKNFGWPVITYGKNYNGTIISHLTHNDGMEQPVLHWTPSIAVCGITFYEGKVFTEWGNNLFATSLKYERLHRLEILVGCGGRRTRLMIEPFHCQKMDYPGGRFHHHASGVFSR